MSRIPEPIRLAKHAIFQFLPGYIGMRNRACFQQLTRKPATEDFLRALESIKIGDVCIDCGANVGAVSQEFSRRNARTYSFEPDPWSFEQLKSNLGSSTGVSLFNKAVGVDTGTLTFYRDSAFGSDPNRHSLASSMLSRPDREQTSIEVEVIDIIEFIKSLSCKIKILKMDIEGAEVPILEALLDDDLIQNIEHIFVETHELQFADLLERTMALREAVRNRGLSHVNLDWH